MYSMEGNGGPAPSFLQTMLITTEFLEEQTQPARLAEMLPRWLELPVYRSRRHGDGSARPGVADAADFTALPFITKRDMRDGFPRNFLPAGHALETLLSGAQVEWEHTSGTSEERTPVLLGRGWWHEQETRALRLNRFVACVLDEHPSARRVTLTTPVCNGTACHSRWAPRSARTDGAILSVNQARIPFLLSDGELARMAEETGEWAPQFLDVDPVHGAWFALYCERNGIRFPFLKFLLCSYEFLSIVHRRILERVFGVPVLNLYGSTETGHLLMEDEQGAMRPSLDTAFLEVVEADRNGVGDLVVTTLSNDYMPLLRYRIGDLVERRGSSSAPTYVIHGRTRDALRAPDGRRVTTWQVDRCFAGTKGIAHYQLRQAENGDLRLRYVPDQAGPDAQAIRQLIARLESVLEAPGRIVAEAKDLLGPATSGKFRLTGRA
jgi:phenylacetate-CoA ligase